MATRHWRCVAAALSLCEEHCVLTSKDGGEAEGASAELCICTLCLHPLQWDAMSRVTHSYLVTPRIYPLQRGWVDLSIAAGLDIHLKCPF